MNKKVFFEPGARMHSVFRHLIDYPPDGYEFVTDKSISGNLLVNSNLLLYKLRPVLEWLVPISPTKSWLERRFKKIPNDIDLIYSYSHPVFHKRPWIVLVEWWHVLVGRNIRHFHTYKPMIERLLASPYCKGIITWCELGKKAIELNYDCRRFEDKMFVVPLAVPPKQFDKKYKRDKLTLLFVGSADNPQDFFLKGGGETILSFIELKKKYANLELIVRANIPIELKNRYQNVPDLRIIDTVIPRTELENEFMSADIFVQPTYDTPFGAFLDAMSYELPIITRDEFANAEIIADGKTGFLVKSAPGREAFLQNVAGYKLLAPTGSAPHAKKFWEQIHTPDTETVADLVKKISLLIENPELKEKLGKTGRQEVENGRFSIMKRNQALKRIFDKAMT